MKRGSKRGSKRGAKSAGDGAVKADAARRTAVPDDALERAAQERLGALAVICGVDEAGRGPLAGPVVAGACRFAPHALERAAALGLRDSKQLSEVARERLFLELLDLAAQGAAALGVGAASVREIGLYNILGANHLAMRRAVARLGLRLGARPDLALVDGNRAPPGLGCAVETVVKGDARCLSIAAASVLAKVTRDRIMRRLAARHAGYGWERNAGYPTAAHREALARLGPTRHHRRGFGGVPA